MSKLLAIHCPQLLKGLTSVEENPERQLQWVQGCVMLIGMRSLFHFAFNVTDLDVARHFYGDVLGCKEGRSTNTWVDFDFYDHQISLHLGEPLKTHNTGLVDGMQVPMPHFGLAMRADDWHLMAKRLRDAGVSFVIEPYLRFAGQPGEQWTMFFLDPFGNPLEIKGFADLASLYQG